MRIRSIAALALLIATTFARADDKILGPADYIAILTDSKLRYNMLSTPSVRPMKMLECPVRTEQMRVVKAANGERALDQWNVKLEALKLANEGETLYQAQDFDGAAAKYRQAIAADPDFVGAYFFLGDALLFGAKDPNAALEQYRKGIALDPTLHTGYLFSSTALVQLGQVAGAREQIVQALLNNPRYDSAWKVLQNSQRLQIKPVVRHKFEQPVGMVGIAAKDGIDIFGGVDAQYLGYAMCKAVWANEKPFADKHSPDAWTLEEERACVLNQMQSAYNATEAQVKKKNRRATEEQIVAALPPLERHLLEVAQARLLDGYILFEIIGQHCPLSTAMLDDQSREQIAQYLRKFVIVPATN